MRGVTINACPLLATKVPRNKTPHTGTVRQDTWEQDPHTTQFAPGNKTPYRRSLSKYLGTRPPRAPQHGLPLGTRPPTQTLSVEVVETTPPVSE